MIIIILIAVCLSTVSAHNPQIKIDDVQVAEFMRMATSWMCRLSPQELTRYVEGGKVKHLFHSLATEEESKHVVTGWLACTLHACKQEILPLYPREHNEQVYMHLMEQLNLDYMKELRPVDFVRIAMLAGCAASPLPAKAALMYQHPELANQIPEHSHLLIETLRILRIAMHIELDENIDKLTDLERYRYSKIFSALNEDLVRNDKVVS